ncbi:MAG TPA: hypothetical protein VEK08_06750 [Planctomycetota bacterium]|nr:hypothetical protein [Planctomycetota bacterium]
MPYLIMPACMSGPDILILLAAITLAPTGLVFLTYWPYRWAMNALACGPLFGKPLALFAAAIGGAVLWIGSVAGITTSVISAGGNGFVALAIVGAVGSLCFLVFIIAWLLRPRSQVSAPTNGNATPPLQVWMQDLIVALLCYGAGLTIISAVNNFDRNRADEVLPYAIYLMVAGTFGLLAALDVSRHSEAGQRALPRAGIFVGIFTLFPVALPVALLAWWRWRRALTRSAV